MGFLSRTPDVPELTANRDFDGLAKALRDDETRDEAMNAIAGLKDPEAVPPLVKLSGKLFTGADSNDAASETLRRLGPEVAVEPLVELLQQKTDVAFAIKGLVGFGEGTALEPLTELRDSEHDYVAKNAYDGLLELGTPKAIKAVAEGLEGGPNQLEAFRSAAHRWEGAEPEIIRGSVAPLRAEPEEMGEHRLEFAAKMLDGLAERISRGEVESDEPIATFVKLLDDPLDRVRLVAANLLGQLLPEGGLEQPDPRMADALDRACSDEYEGIRGAAAAALARQNDPRAVGHLTKLLDAEQEPIAVNAALSLRVIAEEAGLPEEAENAVLAKYDEQGASTKLGQKLAGVVRLIKEAGRGK